MPTKRPFRPVLNDELEKRTVPTGLGGFIGFIGGFGGGGPVGIVGSGLGGSVGTAPSVDAQKVSNDFRTFENSYLTAVYNDLIAPGTPNTGKFAGDPTIAAAFTTLSTSLKTDTASLAANNPTLAATLSGDVTSLQTTLNGLVPPSTRSAVRTFEGLVEKDITTATNQAVKQVANATPPTGTVTQQMFSMLGTQIGNAVQAFNTAVLTAAQKALPANGGTGSTFAPAVTAAASALSSSFSDALGNTTTNLPPALVTSLTTTLNGYVTSIQNSLTNITVPTSTGKFLSTLFEWQVSVDLTSGEGRMFQGLLTAVRTYDASLS